MSRRPLSLWRFVLVAISLVAIARPVSAAGSAKPPPTIWENLQDFQSDLETLLGFIDTQLDPKPYGGNVEKERAAVVRTEEDLAEALVYLQTHPEYNRLPLDSDSANLVAVTVWLNNVRNEPLQTLETIHPELRLNTRYVRRCLDDVSALPDELGGYRTKTLADGWTVVTADGSPSAHFEHTVLTTDAGPEILTLPPA